MLSPQNFAKKTGLSYSQVLQMCKNNELDDIVQTKGGHYKISNKNLDKFLRNENYVSKEDYEKVVRENEKLKTLLGQVKNYVIALDA